MRLGCELWFISHFCVVWYVSRAWLIRIIALYGIICESVDSCDDSSDSLLDESACFILIKSCWETDGSVGANSFLTNFSSECWTFLYQLIVCMYLFTYLRMLRSGRCKKDAARVGEIILKTEGEKTSYNIYSIIISFQDWQIYWELFNKKSYICSLFLL